MVNQTDTLENAVFNGNVTILNSGNSDLGPGNLEVQGSIYTNTIGPNTVAGGITVTGPTYFTSTSTIGNSNSIGSTSGAVNITGDLVMSNSTSNQSIAFTTAGGINIPSFTTRSSGTKIVIYPSVTGSSVDFAIGLSATSLWLSVPNSSNTIAFYTGNGIVAEIGSTTNFYNTTASSSSTTGSVVFSGGIGIQGTSYISSQFYQTDTTAVPSSVGNNAATGSFNMSGALALNGSSSNANSIIFNPINYADPGAINTSRSVGSRLILFPNITSTSTDYAIGIGNNCIWYQTDFPSSHKFFTGTTLIGQWSSTIFTINTDTNLTGNMNVSGFTGGPSIVNSNMQLYIYEDQNQTSTNVLALSGDATYLQSNYIQLTPASAGKTGYAAFQQDPGSSWTNQFDYFYGTGTGGDGLQFFVQQTSFPALRSNNGGWGLCFDELNNVIVGMSPAQTTTSSVGKTSVTLSTWLTTSTWNTIIISFQKGTFRVYINNVYVSGLTFTQLPVGQPSATYFGFVGYCNTSTNVHRIRNVRLEKGVGNCVPVFGSSTVWNAPVGILQISNTTASTSVSTGSFITPGGIGVSGNSFIGGITNITNATNSSSVSTGALIVTGGIGVSGNAFIGGTGNFAGITNITNATNSSSVSTGALIVTGGIGVSGSIFCPTVVLTKGSTTGTLTPTVNTNSGFFTTTSLSTASQGSQTITFTNSKITTTSTLFFSCSTSGTGLPVVLIGSIGTGTATLTLRNAASAAAFNNTITIYFVVF